MRNNVPSMRREAGSAFVSGARTTDCPILQDGPALAPSASPPAPARRSGRRPFKCRGKEADWRCRDETTKAGGETRRKRGGGARRTRPARSQSLASRRLQYPYLSGGGRGGHGRSGDTHHAHSDVSAQFQPPKRPLRAVQGAGGRVGVWARRESSWSTRPAPAPPAAAAAPATLPARAAAAAKNRIWPLGGPAGRSGRTLPRRLRAALAAGRQRGKERVGSVLPPSAGGALSAGSLHRRGSDGRLH